MRFQPDSRLVDLAQEGHDRAFEEIVRRYRASLVSFAGAIVPVRHAEDVVQEALTKAHTALGSSDAEINLKPWLYTIVRNRALNTLRDEPVYDHLDEDFDGVPQPPEVAARREELAALTVRVKGLPAPQREALVKRELEGRSHEEIASSLGVSAGAVRGLIFRARTALRDGAGMLIPMPVLRALLSSGTPAPDATGAAAAAAGIGAGGGGIAVKAGATLGVAVIAVGSGIAIQGHGRPGDDEAAAKARSPQASQVQRAGGPGPGGSSDVLSDSGSDRRHGGPGPSESSGPGGGDGSSGSSSGPGSGSGSSGDRSGSGGGAQSGESGPSGDDGGGDGSGDSGGGETGGSSGSGSSGSVDDGSSSGSGSSGSDDSGGTSGSGSSGDGSDDLVTTTPTIDDSGDGGGGSGPG